MTPFRTQVERDIIVSNLKDPYVVEKVLTSDDINELIQVYKTKNNKIYKNTGPVTSDITKDVAHIPAMKKIFDRLKQEVGECEIYTAFYFYVDFPHIIHNDDDKQGPVVYKAATIPLDIEYYENGQGYPSLCFFDQYYLEGPSKFFGGAKKEIPTFYNTQVYEYSQVQNKQFEKIPSEIYNSYLTHLQPQWLTGLTFKSALEWRPGNMLVFDCVRLHCASDFRRIGVKSKLGISMFTYLPR